MGLPKKSEILWDILAIQNNTNQIKDLKERVEQLEECYNCTTKSKKFIPLKNLKYLWNSALINIIIDHLYTFTVQIWFSEKLLLVSTGYNSYYKGSTQSQVVDTNSPNTCSDLQQYPYPIYGSTGGVLNGYPVICGGWIDESKFTKPLIYPLDLMKPNT